MKIIYSKYTFEEVHNTRRSGYYWQASKEAAANYSSFGSFQPQHVARCCLR